MFIEGAGASAKYMKGLFDDWQAQGITSVLHEKRGGYANNKASMNGLAAKAEAEGVRILSGVEVQSFEFGSNTGAVTALNTNQGRIACETVVVGVGPWVNKIWNMLELPKAITVKVERQGAPRRADVEVLVPRGRHARHRPGDAPDQ